MSTLFRKKAIAAALGLLPFFVPVASVLAAPPPGAPGAGQLLQELPPAQVPATSTPSVKIQEQTSSPVNDSQPFRVESIEISGNTLIDTTALRNLVADGEHRQLTLREANQIAERITLLYQQKGYPLTRAIIPAQTLSGGTLKIQVVEAVYGQVSVHNQSLASDAALLSTVSDLRSGEAVAQAPLDRTMLLLSDTPGVTANATLSPGASVGTSSLDIEAGASERIAGDAVIDNNGNRFTGRTRGSVNLAIASPFSLGDQFTASVLTSGSGLNNASIGYSLPVVDLATRLGGDYSALDYRLGDSLSPLHAFGTASVEDLWVSHNFIRSPEFNSAARLEFANRQLNDSIAATGLHTDRHTDSLTATWNLDLRDAMFGGGANSLMLSATTGHLGFDSAGAALADSKSAKIAGEYNKVDFSVSRLQTLDAQTSLYIGLAGQFSSSNLDSSEQIIAGGATSARGYDVGAASGDEGALFTLELRRRLALPIAGSWQARAFFDSDYIEVNTHQFAVGPNSATLNSLGLGLDWSAPGGWFARLDLAKSIGSTPTLLGSTSTPMRAWLEVSKSF